jgi:hypothetical protein
MKLLLPFTATLCCTLALGFAIRRTAPAKTQARSLCEAPNFVPIRTHEDGKNFAALLERMPFPSKEAARRFLEMNGPDMAQYARAMRPEIWSRLDSVATCLGLGDGPHPLIRVLLSWNLSIRNGRVTAYEFALREVAGAPSKSETHRCFASAFSRAIEVESSPGSPLDYDGPAPTYISYDF